MFSSNFISILHVECALYMTKLPTTYMFIMIGRLVIINILLSLLDNVPANHRVEYDAENGCMDISELLYVCLKLIIIFAFF